ncbi:MAG TPA: hypothetical protein VKB86_18460, partial [Pyrinomonadaceae bacterium]|nr:hypothetical protein [Pyrinomonadaceae bacterium]
VQGTPLALISSNRIFRREIVHFKGRWIMSDIEKDNAGEEVSTAGDAATGAAQQRQNRMLTALFRDRDDAERAYGSLNSRGYTRDDISLLMSDETRRKYFPSEETQQTEMGNKALEGLGIGSAVGGTVGAIIAAIAAIGTNVVLPGLGLTIVGPLAAAFAGAGAGGLTGGLVGAFVGAGIPEERASVYESGLRDGGILIGVNPRTDEDAEYLENEWKQNRAEHVYH